MTKIVLIELNEINFEYVDKYIKRGLLPGFAALIDQYGLACTKAENKYENLEPWIQWVTVHTGKMYSGHKVFRLGDIVGNPVKQIFEELENKGLSVGAISPMNAENRLRQAPYFVPDPWTETAASGGWFLKRLSKAIAQLVNDNAHGKVKIEDALYLVAGLVRFARPKNYLRYLALALDGIRHKWKRAMFLDLMLFDMHEKLFNRYRPDFSVLFVNSGAHIQHHYFFNSKVGAQEHQNPRWYVDPICDPVLDVYQLYDDLVCDFVGKNRDVRVIIATGLRQVPYPKVTFYYRLKHHAKFLERSGLRGIESIQTRMSRDFLVRFKDEVLAKRAEKIFQLAIADDGQPLFGEVDNRGIDLFVTLTYSGEFKKGIGATINGQYFPSMVDEVSLVAIKNGHHDAIGYLLDTGVPVARQECVALSELYDRFSIC